MKKRLITLGVVIALLIISAIYFINEKTVPSGVGLAATYETVVELVENSQVIVSCTVSGKEEEIISKAGDTLFKGFQQEVKIHNVFFNKKDIELSKNDVIKVTDFNQHSRGENWFTVIEHIKTKPGKYVLFLNTIEDEETGEVYYVNNTPNNRYKLKTHKFNSSKEKDKYKNISSDALRNITGEDISKAIENRR